ncbi:hypothetical protein AMTRI_Chr02g265730 [Amborella trichopoda]|uniref:CP12 domain-containing protein n=1 Tax=Amborella trichopoda TaxID=13333 RepID=W1P588_AMBTC|nr:calvin cycle protein CP12-1, chloroplastic [Amborella trichopoda]ERN02130.1 hypothetical protein AMTR_s00045p00175560 [Amborella trichopoda]|eukprot:XP_006840455.1 calvin cycle protein CP12-1, chloroplastic [Amborella trichopoda]
MASLASPGVSLSTTSTVAMQERPKLHTHVNCQSWRGGLSMRRMVALVRATPSPSQNISEKLSESIEHAKEVCSGDAVSGECVAAWDEVEEMSAAASDARLKEKESDPLETYCKDNPETKECRTYED